MSNVKKKLFKIDLNKGPVEKVSDKMERVKVQGMRAFLTKVVAKKGAIIPPHFHEVEQMSLILSGVLRITAGDETVFLEKNTVLVIPKGTLHSGEVLDDAEYVDFWPETTNLFTFEEKKRTNK